MHGVLGGQVRFNIKFRQVGAQATPPLCSVQLWYTFPSGHSPTSTLSGSKMCTDTKINAQGALNIHRNSQSWETSYICRHKALDFSERDTAWNNTLLVERTGAGTKGWGKCGEVTFFLWHTLHLPISAQTDGGDRKGEKKEWVFEKESNVIKHKVSLSALHLIWQSLKLHCVQFGEQPKPDFSLGAGQGQLWLTRGRRRWRSPPQAVTHRPWSNSDTETWVDADDMILITLANVHGFCKMVIDDRR